MSDASAVVDRAAAAVEAADARVTTPPSDEVAQAEKAAKAKRQRAAKAPERKQTTTAKKYTDDQKRIAKEVATVRGERSCGPVQVLRVETALEGRDPLKVLDMPLAAARRYAAGDKETKPSDSLREFGKHDALCPFSRGRGAAAILLALAGKLRK